MALELSFTARHGHQHEYRINSQFLTMEVNAGTFIQSALPMMGKNGNPTTNEFHRAFRGYFSLTPSLCVHVWDEIENLLPRGGKPFHLLWGLLYLKVYASEDVLVAFANTTRKTFRKWSKIVTKLMAHLNYVSTGKCS